MAVFNGEEYLHEAVETILNQTFEDFEFVIVNDGSTDGTFEILNQCKDSRIVRIENGCNLGLAKSLMLGLGVAKGIYIARMDADDISRPHRIEKQIAYLEAHLEIGVLGSWLDQMDENGRDLSTFQPPTTHEMIVWKMLFECTIAHPTVVMRKTLLVQAGGYDPSFQHIEDTELWSRLIHLTRFANLPEALYARRVHRESICSRHGDHQYMIGIAIRHRLFCGLLGVDVGKEAVEWLSMALYSKRSLNPMQIGQVITLLGKAYGAFVTQVELKPQMVRDIQADLVKRCAMVDRRLNHINPPFMLTPLSEVSQACTSILDVFWSAVMQSPSGNRHLKGIQMELGKQLLRLLWDCHYDRAQMLRVYAFVMQLSVVPIASTLGLKVLLRLLLGHRMIGVMKQVRNRVKSMGSWTK